MSRFCEDRAQAVRRHRHNTIGTPNPGNAFNHDGYPDRAWRNTEHQNAVTTVALVVDVNPQMQLLPEPAPGALQLPESLGPGYASRAAVCDPKDKLAASLVCQRGTVFDQLVEAERARGLLELQMLTLYLG